MSQQSNTSPPSSSSSSSPPPPPVAAEQSLAPSRSHYPRPVRTIRRLIASFCHEIGLSSLLSSSLDVKLLCLSRFVRFFAYGGTTLILALYLSSLGISDGRIGLFMTLTLLGDVVISFVLTLIADAVGRRNMLMLGAAMMICSGVVFGLAGNYWVLVVASVVGVISPSGNEIGPFKAIEESTLSQLTQTYIRNDIFTWYILIGLTGHATGTVTCGWIVDRLQQDGGWSDVEAYRLVFFGYAALGLVKFLLAALLSRRCEHHQSKRSIRNYEATTSDGETRPLLASDHTVAPPHEPNGSLTPIYITRKICRMPVALLPSISRQSLSILLKLCLLFAIDCVASGLTPASWIAYYFSVTFSLPPGPLGSIFFTLSSLASLSNFAVAPLVRRIGYIRTMVFTHAPASIALALIPFPGHLWQALVLLFVRASINSMDQAPRQAFIAAAVLPGERTAVMGALNVVRTLGQSVGPVGTGGLAERGKWWVAFVTAGGLKLIYDGGLLWWFWGFESKEKGSEETGPNVGSEVDEGTRTVSEGNILQNPRD